METEPDPAFDDTGIDGAGFAAPATADDDDEEEDEAFWKTKVFPEPETLGVAEVMEERRRRVAGLCRRNDPHCMYIHSEHNTQSHV